MDLLIISIPAIVSAFIAIIVGYLTGGLDAVLSLSVYMGLLYLFSQIQLGMCSYASIRFPKIKWLLFLISFCIMFLGNHNEKVVSAFSSMSIISLVIFQLSLFVFGFFIAMTIDYF